MVSCQVSRRARLHSCVYGSETTRVGEDVASPPSPPSYVNALRRKALSRRAVLTKLGIIDCRPASIARVQGRVRADGETESLGLEWAPPPRIHDDEVSWFRELSSRTCALLIDLYGSISKARMETQRDELDCAIEVAFRSIDADKEAELKTRTMRTTSLAPDVRRCVFRTGDARRLRTQMANTLRISRHQIAWRKMISAKLVDMVPKHRPDIGALRRLGAKRIFILDLCSFESSFAQAVTREKLDVPIVVISVDNDKRVHPTWCEDVTKWREWLPSRLKDLRETYPDFDAFDYVHFSPECTELCQLKGGGARDIAGALWLALCGMALILELAPPAWTIESSYLGPHALAKHIVMRGLESRKLDRPIHFCMADGVGNWKPGQWWTNISTSMLDRIYAFSCIGSDVCLHKFCKNCHRHPSQRGPSWRHQCGLTPGLTRAQYMGLPWLIPYRWIEIVLVRWLPSKPWS
jgi:hypothetical protein